MPTVDMLLNHLQTSGLLLQHDTALLSVTALIVYTPIFGSWWSHPQGNQIYALLNTLTEHPDVLVVKLVRGKATFLHRRLWPALLGVACAHEEWQFAKLSKQALTLYEEVEELGVLRATGTVPKELERRLLVQSSQQHTERGHHELQLMSWRFWAEQCECTADVPALLGRLQLEEALQTIGGRPDSLPWYTKNRAK
ncbi:MAG: hypothetical protein U0175_14750 [Caldilineaceae bacterium]